MAMPGSGPISLYQANVELGRPGGQAISMDDGGLRALAGVGGGAWAMSSLYGKSSITVSINNATSSSGPTFARRDQSTFTLNVTGGTPSSYSWSQDNLWGEVVGSTTSSSFVVRGPGYDAFNGNTYPSNGNCYCDVVVNGQTFSVQIDFQLTVSDGPL